MLSELRPQIQWTQDAERIVMLATVSADRLIRKLLIESIASWAAKGFDRYNEHEISFTVRLYSSMLEVKAANRGEMLMLHPQYDGPLPTSDMLLGLADVAKSPRPDLTIRCGEASIHIEAKRLTPTGGLPDDYVSDGMMRFLDGRYISPGVGLALMFGYILNGEPSECYDAVNSVIRTDPRLGPAEITKVREILGLVSIRMSKHKMGEITHYAVDVRARVPSMLQSRSAATQAVAVF